MHPHCRHLCVLPVFWALHCLDQLPKLASCFAYMRSCWVPNICNLWSLDQSETHSHRPGNQTPGITLSPLTAQCAGHYYLPLTCRMNLRPREDTTATHSLSSFHMSLPNTEVRLKPAFVTCLSVGNRSRQEEIPIRVQQHWIFGFGSSRAQKREHGLLRWRSQGPDSGLATSGHVNLDPSRSFCRLVCSSEKNARSVLKGLI